jgi:nucleoside-diphosphate kinase
LGKPFFAELANFMTSGPAVQLVLAGDDAIAKVRTINGATNPAKAEPGTIRYDWATSMTENAVHSSDGPASAEREIAFWFKPEEIFEYQAFDQRAKSVL